MVHERKNSKERPHTTASQPQQGMDKILLVSGVCIPIGLLLFVVGAVLARTPTPGAGLMVLVLACLLFIGGVVVFILELVVRHVSARPR
jgi:hypothetical protein